MITLSKIAELAHVSVSTASKAFSMSNEINAETRKMIFDIAKQYGVFKKYYKAKYPKYVIAVICPEFESRHYSNVLSLIQKYLAQKNCEVCTASTDFSPEIESNLLKYYNEYTSVDGILLLDGLQSTYTEEEIPLTVISYNTINPTSYSVSAVVSLQEAVTEIIEYFVSKNVLKIGFIGESLTVSKLDCFKKVMKKRLGDFDPALISITNERFEEGGFAAMEKFFCTGNIPRAIVCAYDHMAIGAIRCIYDHGLRVPEDIAIVGMDNISESRFLNPPLASIDYRTAECCKIAIDMLLRQLTEKTSQEKISMKAEFLIRRSAEID